MLELAYPEGLQPMGRTHIGEGGEHEEEGVAEMRRYRLITLPIPHRPALLGSGRQRNWE